MSNDNHEHVFEDICGEEICGVCYENELMEGKVKYAPKHARNPLVKERFITVHFQNYLNQINSKSRKNAGKA